MVETLQHVLLVCPAHEGVRRASGISGWWAEKGADVLCLHRERWSWKLMRKIRKTIQNMLMHRTMLAGFAGKKGQQIRREEVAELWQASLEQS